jgi:hypothetical protein
MDSEGVSIREVTFASGIHELKLDENSIYAMYLLSGEVRIAKNDILEHDFVKIQEEQFLKVEVKSQATFFEIVSPKQLSYKTYKEIVKY